ncbi:major capsid protein [Paenibacillus sp. UASWS1643]|uniref:major capsid protein n=1 Tax=Paenibacillus sp. UASWS1643 TaxID=2580422 RepID=UPI00123B2DEB|nr:major capsid protein [Paenibacillus sp. UASWS1643]KAA8750104.1 hypothetical protein FE296_16025 [Paenibacillus sp. UASWS1643]
MADYHEILEIPTLIQTLESFPQDSSYLTDSFSTEGTKFETEEVEIRTKKGNRPLAPYVSELLPGKVIARGKWSAKTFKPAMLRPSRIISKHDLKVAGVNETLINPKSPAERYEDLIIQDLADLKASIHRRKVQQLAQIMFTGKTEQIGEGVSQILDWEFENIEILSGTSSFADDSFDVVGYLTQKKLDVMKGSGLSTRKVLATFEVAQRIVTHPTLLALIDAKKETLDVGNLNQQVDGLPNGVIYHGYLRQAALHIWSYTNSYTDEAGNEVDYIPEGTLAMLPDGEPFRFDYGAIEVMDDEGNVKYADTDMYPQVFTQKRPIKRELELLSKPLCIPENVNGWYVVKAM